jgi:Rieske Fe-S protein
MDRRGFLRACGIAAGLLLLKGGIASPVKKYRRALLLGKDERPLKPEGIEPQEAYLFFYPYLSTPCFLIDLGEEVPGATLKLEDGTTYRWSGGIGPRKSIVSLVAICTHQLSYPTKERSFINYYPRGMKGSLSKRDMVIQCCAHMSSFDPRKGGRKIEGPAKNPLPIVMLEESDEGIYAVGVAGVDIFPEFFDVFRRELRKEYGSTRRAKSLVDSTKVIKMTEYVSNQIRC